MMPRAPPPVSQRKDNFGIFDQATLMDLWKKLTGVIATAMVGVVSVFLVIGGVVIMNVMLATVTERTREIGNPQSPWRPPQRHSPAIPGLKPRSWRQSVGAIGVSLA